MLSSRIYPGSPQFNTELAIRANAERRTGDLPGELPTQSCAKMKKKLVKYYHSGTLLNFTLNRDVSLGGNRILLAATLPDSTQIMR